MVLLGGLKTLLLPLTLVVAIAKFLFGVFSLLLKKWFSIDLIDKLSIKGSRCSMDGLFKENSTQGNLTEDNLKFFSKIIIDFYRKNDVALSDNECEKSIVKSFQLDKSAINYLADINFFVEIDYDLDHPWVKQVGSNNLPQSVFIKTLPKKISGRIGQVLLSIHECEGINFAEVFSKQDWFPSYVMPAVVYANYNYYSTDYLIISEDLRGKYQFKGYFPKVLSKEEKLKVLETLAKLHASGMAYLRSFPEKERQIKIDELDKKSPVFYKKIQTAADLVMLLLHRFSAKKMKENNVPPEIVEQVKQFFKVSRIVANTKLCVGAEEMLSFVHRDLHFNNIGIGHDMVNGVDTVSVKLVDWQCCGLGNPLFDIFYLLCFTSDLETIEANEKEYLENYFTFICKELDERGLSKPKQLESYENYMEFYKDAMCAFLSWSLAMPLIQLQAKDKTMEIYVASKNFLQVGSHLMMKYDALKRLDRIINLCDH